MNILCSHFPACSGCSVNEDVANIPAFKEAETFFCMVGKNEFKLNAGKACGWRTRARLAVRGDSDDPLIGLYEAGTHNVVNIPKCRVHHPLINQAAEYLRVWIITHGIVPYDEKSGKGVLRYVEMAVDRINQRVQIALILNQRQDEALSLASQNTAFKSLWDKHPGLWHSLWLNFNTRRDNIILGNRWTHLYGEEWLWDRFCGRDVCFHPASFAQANPEMFERLLIELKKHVPQGTNVVEFYAGGGAIGLTLIDKCKNLCCNEIVPLAERCFEESVKRLPEGLKNKLAYVCGPAEKQMKLLNSPVDVVIVDPPRKGIDAELLNALCNASTVKRLIYVSCGWKSFKRDCEKLLENGWKLIFAESYLFFPGSNHLEILAVFDKLVELDNA